MISQANVTATTAPRTGIPTRKATSWATPVHGRAPEESLKQADADEWAAALAHHFAVTCPELHTDDGWMEEGKEVKIDVSHDPMRAIIDPHSDAARKLPGHRVVVPSTPRPTSAYVAIRPANAIAARR